MEAFMRYVIAVIIVSLIATHCLSGTTSEMDKRRKEVERANEELQVQLEIERTLGADNIQE
jgi:hypothetical protein